MELVTQSLYYLTRKLDPQTKNQLHSPIELYHTKGEREKRFRL